MKISNIKQIISKNKFLKNISITLAGTFAGQLIPILLSPVLSRIFLPSVFGFYAVFISFSTILYTVVSFSFDQAISISKTIEESICLFKLVLILAGSVCGFLMLILIPFHAPIARLLNMETISWVVPLIPVYAFLYAAYMCCYFVYVRWDEMKSNSALRITMPLVVVGCNLLFAVVYRGDASLIISQVVAYAVILLLQFKALKKCFIKNNLQWEETQLTLMGGARLIRRYRHFATKYMPSLFLNNLTIQLPAILINSYFGGTISGYYSLANKTLNTPVAAVGTAFGDVYRNEAYEEYSTKGSFEKTFKRSFKILILLGVIPFTLLFFFSPQIFSFVFGEAWVETGRMSTMMTPMYLMKFIAVPLSFSLVISNKHSTNFVLQLLLFIGSCLSFVVGALVCNSSQLFILVYTICFTAVYLFYVLYSRKLSKIEVGLQ